MLLRRLMYGFSNKALQYASSLNRLFAFFHLKNTYIIKIISNLFHFYNKQKMFNFDVIKNENNAEVPIYSRSSLQNDKY